MVLRNEKNQTWLNVAGTFWGVIGVLCVVPAFCSVVFHDSPLSGSEIGVLDYISIYGALCFPFICFGSGLGIELLKVKHADLAFYISLLPVIPLILLCAVFTIPW